MSETLARSEDLLEAVLPLLVTNSKLLSFFLLHSNRRLSDVAARQAYNKLHLVFYNGIGAHHAVTPKVASVLSNPRYGNCVDELQFSQSVTSHDSTDTHLASEVQAQGWSLAASVIKACPHLKTLEWRAAFGVGGEAWKAITDTRNLRKLYILPPRLHAAHERSDTPRITPYRSSISDPACGWELGAAWNGLSELHLSPLSSFGSKTLASHFRRLAQDQQPPPLESLMIDAVFLDVTLCFAIAEVGKRGNLKRLQLSTSGTKLSTEAFVSLVEGCVALEELTLKDVQGRLDKDTWQRIKYPTTLKRVVVEIRDYGQHHSWVHLHLTSIHCVPISQLSEFAVHRTVPPLATLPYLPALQSLKIPPVHDLCKPQVVPAELLKALVAKGATLSALSLDWWQCDATDVEQLARACVNLEKLQLLIGCPLHKIIAMTTPFSNMSKLVTLSLSIPREHASCAVAVLSALTPRKSPSNISTPPSPSTSLAIADLPHALSQHMQLPDPTLPPIKDIRKFVRRLPRLRDLIWAGRDGKGVWSVTRIDEKKAGSDISFVHSALNTLKLWHEAQETAPTWQFLEETVASIQEEAELVDIYTALSPTSTVLNTPSDRNGSISTSSTLGSPSLKTPSPKKQSRRMSLPADPASSTQVLVGLGLDFPPLGKNKRVQTATKTSSSLGSSKTVSDSSSLASLNKMVTANGWRVAKPAKKKMEKVKGTLQ